MANDNPNNNSNGLTGAWANYAQFSAVGTLIVMLLIGEAAFIRSHDALTDALQAVSLRLERLCEINSEMLRELRDRHQHAKLEDD